MITNDNEAGWKLRYERNAALKACDWTVLTDAPLSESKKDEWKTWRQELRDITNGIDTPEQAQAILDRVIIFPNEPKGSGL